jgi:hypothetical protein
MNTKNIILHKITHTHTHTHGRLFYSRLDFIIYIICFQIRKIEKRGRINWCGIRCRFSVDNSNTVPYSHTRNI